MSALDLLVALFIEETFGFDIDHKLSANVELAFDIDWAPHFLNDLLTYRQPQACTWFVSIFVFLKLAEVNEQVFDPLWWHSDPIVNNADLKLDILFSGGRAALFTQFGLVALARLLAAPSDLVRALRVDKRIVDKLLV